jgi:murein DD-endopeptidase MepM/ murein hydrolase activator NlpD
MRVLGILLVVLLLLFGGVFFVAGRMAGPAITIDQPEKFVGASTPLKVTVTSPGEIEAVEVAFEQGQQRTSLVSQAGPQLARDASGAIVITHELNKQTLPSLASGPARIVVTASRPVVYGLRTVASESTRDVTVRLERPRVGAISTHHYINHGGTEMVVYRVSPEDVASGVRVGDIEYPGFPAAGAAPAGGTFTDTAVRVAFFALRYDQALNTPIRLFARDEAGNSTIAEFDKRVFPKRFDRSRIPLKDTDMERLVPVILQGAGDFAPAGSTLEKFVAINSELRRRNNEQIASFAAQTAPDMLWRGEVFHSFRNTSAEAAFADFRTYVYGGREVDRQVHLGFDLASFAGTPVVAANHGTVLFADDLGIYGNAVIIDHGMGVQSLYAHLSTIDVSVGAMVAKEQTIGRSGQTGMALGDHLHFTMLVNGQMVNPIEWWDGHWIQDRILRKLTVNTASGDR